jgi:hypothetical protein
LHESQSLFYDIEVAATDKCTGVNDKNICSSAKLSASQLYSVACGDKQQFKK